MNTSDDRSLSDLFQAQRRNDASTTPAFAASLQHEPISQHAPTPVFRMAFAAGLVACAGLALVLRFWFLCAHAEPPLPWATLTAWNPITDSLLEATSSSISDATALSDALILDDTSAETNNKKEML